MFTKIAVFIDADNAQASKIESVLQDVSAYGRIVTKRAYANWTKPQVKPWEEKVKRFAIGTIQQFDFATGKNASDMALTIDAMDMLHTGNYDCFVIVSSDSDFTALAIKLHESGVFVIGYGNKLTVESFRNACDEFNYVDDLDMDGEPKGSENQIISENSIMEGVGNGTNAEKNVEEQLSPSEAKEFNIVSANKDDMTEKSDNVNNGQITEDVLDSLLKIAEEKYALDDGFVNVSSAGTYIKRVRSDFSIKAFGFDKLPEYLKSKPEKYDVEERQGKGVVKLILYRSKKID